MKLAPTLLIVLTTIILAGCGERATPAFSTEELDGYEARFLTEKLIKKEGWVTRVGLKEKQPKRTGKVLLMVPKEFAEFTEPKNQAHVHKAFAELPEEMRAAPGKVDTVIILRPEKMSKGRYSNGAGAYQWETDMFCFDVASGEYLGRHKIMGEEPPRTTESNEGNIGGGDNIAKFVTELPLTE